MRVHAAMHPVMHRAVIVMEAGMMEPIVAGAAAIETAMVETTMVEAATIETAMVEAPVAEAPMIEAMIEAAVEPAMEATVEAADIVVDDDIRLARPPRPQLL